MAKHDRDLLKEKIRGCGFELREQDQDNWYICFSIIEGDKIIFQTTNPTFQHARPILSAFIKGYMYRDKEVWEL